MAALTVGIQNFCQRIEPTLEDLNFAQRRQLVELLVDRVIVNDEHVEIRYVIPTSPAGEISRFCHLRKDYFDPHAPAVEFASLASRRPIGGQEPGFGCAGLPERQKARGVAMLLAVPFGTIAYMAIYGFFNTGSANAVLSLLMLLKIAFVVCLVVAQQRFLQNMALVVLVFTSLIGNVVLGLLHGFVPRFLVSITDALGAIVLGICGFIWLILMLIGSVNAIINSLKLKGA